MTHVRILKIRKLPTELQAQKQAQKQAHYQHDVATLIADHVLREELLFTSIGFYSGTNNATRFLELTLATSASEKSVQRKLKRSKFNFHWSEPLPHELAEMDGVFWKLLCCFPEGAPSVYTETRSSDFSTRRKETEAVTKPLQTLGCTILLRYKEKRVSDERQTALLRRLNTKYSAAYGFRRMERGFYDDGGFPSRVVKLYFGSPEQADAVKAKMSDLQEMDGLADAFTTPTVADMEFVEGNGSHRGEADAQGNFGLEWRIVF